MTYLPSAALEALNGLLSERSVVQNAGALLTSLRPSSVSGLAASLRNPRSLTIRVEAFAVKRVAKAAPQPAGPEPDLSGMPVQQSSGMGDEEELLSGAPAPLSVAPESEAVSSPLHESIVPQIRAVMNAMYERAGYDFSAVLSASDVPALSVSDWVRCVSGWLAICAESQTLLDAAPDPGAKEHALARFKGEGAAAIDRTCLTLLRGIAAALVLDEDAQVQCARLDARDIDPLADDAFPEASLPAMTPMTPAIPTAAAASPTRRRAMAAFPDAPDETEGAQRPLRRPRDEASAALPRLSPVRVSDHLFVYNKKSKVMVVVVVCGR
jgi:hypothetical protein